VRWLEEHVGLGDRFFATFLRTDEDAFRHWRDGRASLSPDRQESLRHFWRTILHLLSFLNFDEQRVRRLLEHPAPSAPRAARSPLAPPWSGASLKEHLEAQGPDALADVERWVTAFRFGDPYAA
jgi:phytoene dehydrogenase-like protein